MGSNLLLTDDSTREAVMHESHLNCPLTDALMNTVDALVVVADPEGRILQFNKACELLTGYSAAEVVGRSVVETLVPAEQRDDVATIIDDLPTSVTNRFENEWIAADGKRRRIMWTNATMSDSSGRVQSVLGTGIDVTDQRALESRLAQADRLDSIGQLAAGIAHDFDNTLTSLCLRIERLSARDLDSDSRIDIEAIANTIDRAQNVITELLSFSSPHLLAPTHVDLNAEVRGVHNVLGAIFRPDVEVEFDLSPCPATVLIDPVGFEQALTNLLLNARDAMPDGGQLTITTAIETIPPGTVAGVAHRGRSGRYVRLSVADTGTGICSDDLAHVFDPYFTTKPSGRGTGLGLSTAYVTINQSNGVITADSEPGQGTTFDVWLPLVIDDR